MRKSRKLIRKKKSTAKKASKSAKRKPTSKLVSKRNVQKPQATLQAAIAHEMFLYTDDAWSLRYFDPNDLHFLEREVFGQLRLSTGSSHVSDL